MITASAPETMVPEEKSSASRTRVIHLLHTMAYGGPETIIINWLRSMDHVRYENHLVIFRNDNNSHMEFVVAAEAAGLRIHYIDWNRSKPAWKASSQLIQLQKELGADILHCYNTYADLVGVITRWRTGIPIITTMWMWGSLGWKREVLQKLETFLLRFFNVVTAQSKDAQEATMKRLPGRDVPILIGGLPFNEVTYSPEQRDQLRSSYGASSHEIVLVHVARFWPEKAHEVLIEGFRQIVEKEPNARLWVVGIGPEKPKIESLVKELNLESSVSFLGFRDDLYEFLPLADIQVHPSDTEGLPLAVCTGMCAGLPVVATRVGGMPEVVRDGISGFLVEKRNPEQFAQAVLKLIRNEDLRKQLGNGARNIITTEYSLQAATSRLTKVYEGMLTK